MNKTQELMKRIEVYFPTVVHERLLIDFGNINVRLLHEAYHELERLSEGNFTPEEFNNLCHNKKPVTRCEFEEECKKYTNELYGEE